MIQHTTDCDDLMTGRALRSIIDQDMRVRSVSLPELTARRDAMRAFEVDGRCGCAQLALGRIVADLARERKAQRYAFDGNRVPVIAGLIQERDEIRAYLTARNAAV